MVPDPAGTDQVTATDSPAVVPVTVALKVVVPPVRTEAEDGVTLTTCGGGAVTVTVADPLLVVSAALVATTWQVAPAFGAVYVPVDETDPQLEPSWTVHVTDRLAVPVTSAAKTVDPPKGRFRVLGFTATATCCAGAFFFTRTTLVPLLFTDAMALSARTWKVPSIAGAV
jgi:hypothetical protein